MGHEKQKHEITLGNLQSGIKGIKKECIQALYISVVSRVWLYSKHIISPNTIIRLRSVNAALI